VFDSVTAAFVYGVQYIFADSARPIRSDDDNDLDFWDLLPWTTADGTTWCIPYLSRYLTLCDTLNSVAAGLKPDDDPSLFLTTEKRQLLIGLGTDLPHTDTTRRMLKLYGYTLEHNASQTVNPNVIYMEQIAVNKEQKNDDDDDDDDDLPNIIELPFVTDIDYEAVD
jgi:hypothetical protein